MPALTLTIDAADEWAEEQRQAGRRVVFTNGVYDLVHPGHIEYLEAAKAAGDVLIVAVNSDRSLTIINTGGANRLFANVEFSNPTFYSAQDGHQDYLSNAHAPFTFGVSRCPLTDSSDGILKRPATDPVLIEAVDENSFWTWKNSLQVVDGRGSTIPIPDKVRLYFKAGAGHLGIHGLLSPPLAPRGFMGECQYAAQALNAPAFNPQSTIRNPHCYPCLRRRSRLRKKLSSASKWSPCRPDEKQWKNPRLSSHLNDAVFSALNGDLAQVTGPFPFKATPQPTSTSDSLCRALRSSIWCWSKRPVMGSIRISTPPR